MENSDKLDKYIQLLEANKNIILTGAPGTGKTHLAKAIAERMGAEYEFVQFHPSYDYTDFVEGLRPTPPDKNGNIGFERKDGVFKEFCKGVINNSKIENNDYDVIISKEKYIFLTTEDEINNAIQWFRDTMNGKSIETHKEKKPIKIKISDKRIDVYNSNDKVFYISPNTTAMEKLKRYLRTGKYFKGKDTYVPSVGKYILENFPNKNNETNTYILQERTSNNETKYLPNIFIIDEINRGEISKIFGELFFSIDPGYRGEKGLVKTQYQNLITDESDPFYEGFYVPENVYIIGTMNDIDRSVESMDFAMRRRFAWIEIKANENTGMLDDEKLSDMKDEIISIMKRLNAAIWDEDNNTGIEGLSAAYHIGGSYFSKLSLYLNKEHTNKQEAYENLWNNHLKGVLFEYLRGTINAMENLKMLERVYFNQDIYGTEG